MQGQYRCYKCGIDCSLHHYYVYPRNIVVFNVLCGDCAGCTEWAVDCYAIGKINTIWKFEIYAEYLRNDDKRQNEESGKL